MIDSDASTNPENMKHTALEDLLQILICPDCQGELSLKNSAYKCSNCERTYPVRGRIIILLPSDLEEVKRNEDKYYKDHRMEGKGKPAWMALAHKREDIKFLTDEFLPKHKHEINGRFLEIGSGSCWASSIIENSCRPKLEKTVASDVSLLALQKGVEVAKSMGANINYFITCDTEMLPFKEEAFDVIFGSAIIHHFLNTEKGVSEIRRVLTREGVYLGINETVTNTIFTFFSRSRFWHVRERAKERGITEKVFSWDKWIELFRRGGFKKVCIDLECNPEYKLRASARTRARWLSPLYYRIISLLPDFLVRHYLASSISIVAKK